MTTQVAIWNMALAHVGSDSVIVAPTDTSVEAGHCSRFWTVARHEAINIVRPTWARSRVALALTTNPSTVWTYAYAKPSDCLTPLRVLPLTYLSALSWPWSPVITEVELATWNEQGSSEFEREGDLILTHEPNAVLMYLRDVTDTAEFGAPFVVGLSYLLASFIVGPIVKGTEGATASVNFRRAAMALLRAESANDANSTYVKDNHVPDHMKVR